MSVIEQLQKLVKELMDKCSELDAENDRLKKQVKQLESEVKKLGDIINEYSQ